MRSNFLCLCLLALVLAAGSTGAKEAKDFSHQESVEMSGVFSQNFLEGLFGTDEIDANLAQGWLGPQFENTSSAYSFLHQFYINTSAPAALGPAPIKIDVNQRLPARIYFGSGKEVTYTAYQSALSAARSNELWIEKYLDWSQYGIVPLGMRLQFIAFAPAGGQADYYEILQTDVQKITFKRINFYPGYNSLSFPADQVGRHILLFVQNNQPSNAVIVDVIRQAPPALSAAEMPPTSDMPPAYGQTGAIAGSYVPPVTAAATPTGPGPVYPGQTAMPGDTPVTIQSVGLRGYQVFIDEIYLGTEGTNGDIPDGIFNIMVVGGQNHDVRVWDGEFNHPSKIFFPKGVLKIINV